MKPDELKLADFTGTGLGPGIVEIMKGPPGPFLFTKTAKGDRKPDDWLGCINIRNIHPGLRFPFECYEFVSGGRWQPQVAGAGVSIEIGLCLPCPLANLSTGQLVFPSGQLANRSTDQLVSHPFSPLLGPLPIRHRLSHPSPDNLTP